MKDRYIGMLTSIVWSVVTYLFGGWDNMLKTVLLFMAIDYVTGIITAAVFKKSKKTKSGRLSSRVGLQGIFKKFGMLIMISVAYRIDVVLNMNNLLLYAAQIAIISNESISILENLVSMGVPIPKKLTDVIDSLTSTEG